MLLTVVYIIKDFTNENKQIKIVFTGSTLERTVLYQRILKTYYSLFSKEFKISTLSENEGEIEEVPFNENYKGNYLAFFVKRII